jgi:hypothetical protein
MSSSFIAERGVARGSTRAAWVVVGWLAGGGEPGAPSCAIAVTAQDNQSVVMATGAIRRVTRMQP